MIKAILLIVLIVLLGFFAYNFYKNYNSSPVYFYSSISGNSSFYEANSMQFYHNMRFQTREITYSVDSVCDSIRKKNMALAFEFIEGKTNLTFVESSSPEIEVLCDKNLESLGGGLFTAGEGGPSIIINTSLFNIILNGKIILYSDSCGYNVELHEMLHVLGFPHSDNPRSVMYNVSKCNQVVPEELIDEINRLYLFESLPDLYFSDVSAVKKGVYLSLNISINNQGISKSRIGKLILESDSVKREEFELQEIGIGEGRTIVLNNLRIPEKTRNLTLEIIFEDEISLDNNKALLFI